MKKFSTLVLSTLLGGSVLFTATAAYSQQQQRTVNQPQPSSEDQTDDELAYRICFYKKQDYQEVVFCRIAPSFMGLLSVELWNNIRSIKISDSLGRKIKSPQIQLKVCDKSWRRGNCKVFNGSQKDFPKSFDGPVVSYAFNVRL